MAITGIDHIVLRVKDIDEGIASYKKLGLELTKTLETPGIGKQAIFRLSDDTFVELVAPTDADSAIARAIDRNGEGLHTVAFSVDDVKATADEVANNNATVLPMVDDKTAYVHPKSMHGLLVQLQNKSELG
jgi:methylmalonyl-CoA/ethylmalonyl-CoA epimerase